MGWTRREAPDIPEDDLREACRVPERFIAKYVRHKVVGIRKRDAGRYATILEPRIIRDWSQLRPMEWVAGDVKHLNIFILCPDGKLRTPKIVAWQDIATNRLHVTIFLLEAGKAITRRQVAIAFMRMCSDPDWGAPTRLYLDHGGEYNWMEFVEDLTKLKHRVVVRDWADLDDRPRRVRRARPYNPQAKVIESLFGAMNRELEAQFPGYVGDDRLKKKTQNQGRDPEPFPGDFHDFEAAFTKGMEWFHWKRQRGSRHLNGSSPFERFRRFVEEGWKSYTLDTAQLTVAFYTETSRQTRKGGCVSVGGAVYRSDALLTYAVARPVFVRIPLIDDGRGVARLRRR